MPYDLLIKGGHVLDPGQNLDGQFDIAVSDGKIVAIEALLRWEHPSRGYIPPAVFVRVAEESGLMDQLGEFVLRRALDDAVRWPTVYISVNLSPLQVRDHKLVSVVAAMLRETRLDRARLATTIKCGRPGTGMPAFDKFAYSDGRCYGMKQADLKTPMPDPPATFQNREIDLVVDFLLAEVVGKGPMDRAKCIEYWGSDVDACKEFK